MFAEFSSIAVLILLMCAPAVGQTSAPPTENNVIGAGFFQDQDQPSGFQADFETTDFRLCKLENDVSKRFHSRDLDTNQEEDSKPDEGIEERLAKLEESLKKQEEAIDEIDTTLPKLVLHGHKNTRMTFTGRIHLDYWAFPQVDSSLFPLEFGGNPQDRVVFRRLRLGVKGDLNDNVFYKFEEEFAGGDLTSYRDAYIGIRDLPRLNTLIIGNHKRPYGLDHLNSSRYNIFIERPYIIESFNADARRLGISSNGVSDNQVWTWRYGVFNESLTQATSGYIGDHYQLEFAGRLSMMPWYDESSGGRGYAHFAVSGSVGNPDGLGGIHNAARYGSRPEARSNSRWIDTGRIAGADTNMLFGLETVINVGAFQFAGEYMRSNVDRLDSFGRDLEFDGGYVQCGYFLTGEHMTWNRKTATLGRVKPIENFFAVRDCNRRIQRGLGAWQIAARYSWGDLTDEDIIGGEADAFTLGVNWHWNPYTRMQFNWLIGDVDRFPRGGGDYQILGVRLMVDF